MAARGARADTFHLVYHTHYGAIAAYVRRRVHTSEAEDVIAETFLVAWRRLEDIPAGEMALAWLYGVARRVISDRQRSIRRRERLLARLLSFGQKVEELDESASMVEHSAVQSALAQLRPADQELLRLAEWEELTTAELAGVLRCSKNAVAIRLHRAHRRFAHALASADADGAAVSQPEGSA
jgi:RNA polymerase sigma-70 factor (ECF subfamily)